MPFSDLLTTTSIRTRWEPSDKWIAIQELVACVREAGDLTTQSQAVVVEAVLERERKMSTGMEHGIAIPHANTAAVTHMTAALGISKQGFDFQSLDGEPAHIVVLLIYPNSQLQAHVRLLAMIARLLSQEQVREQLMQCETPAEALDVLRREEQG